MTIALSPASALPPGSAGPARSGSGTGSDARFDDLLAAEIGNAPAGRSGDARIALRSALSGEAPASTDTTMATTLGELLEDLKAALGELLEGLEDETAPGSDLVTAIQDLLAQARGLLGAAGGGDALSDAFAALDAGQRQSLDALLDTVAGQAAEAAGGLGDSPIADALSRFARLLDQQAASLPAGTATDPDMLARLADAETTTALHGTGEKDGTGKDAGENEPVDFKAAAAREGRSTATQEGAQANRGATLVEAMAAARAAGGAQGAQTDAAATRPADSLDAMATVPTAPTTPTTQTTALPGAASFARADAPINIPYVATEIARHVQNGTTRFEIRLNPPEMGRIDVRLEFDASGNVNARLAVERSETLDLLQRDQRALERALAQAGVDAGKTSLEFSLRQGGSQGQGQGNERDARDAAAPGEREIAAAEPSGPAPATVYRGYVRTDAVNLFI